jgi:hypothetical protein
MTFAGTTGLTLIKFGKTFEVRETNGKFFYFSRLAGRWLPIKKSEVSDIRSEVAEAVLATKH